MSPEPNTKPAMRLFTPDLKKGATYPGETMEDGRAIMAISWEDNVAWEDAKEQRSAAVITDLNTDTRWVVRSAPCGLGCHCAAYAEPVVPNVT